MWRNVWKPAHSTSASGARGRQDALSEVVGVKQRPDGRGEHWLVVRRCEGTQTVREFERDQQVAAAAAVGGVLAATGERRAADGAGAGLGNRACFTYAGKAGVLAQEGVSRRPGAARGWGGRVRRAAPWPWRIACAPHRDFPHQTRLYL